MPGPFDVLMIDPPWPPADKRGLTWHGGRSVSEGADRFSAPYEMMTVAQVGALLEAEILPLLAPRCAVFLWTVDRLLMDAEAMMEQRGYRRYLRFVWDKGNGPVIGPYGMRRTHEYLIWLYRGGLLPIAPAARGRFGTVIHAPQREHSRKPEAAYRLVEALYPDARRLDAFTRELHPGWDGMGDQRDHFTPLLAGLREEAI